MVCQFVYRVYLVVTFSINENSFILVNWREILKQKLKIPQTQYYFEWKLSNCGHRPERKLSVKKVKAPFNWPDRHIKASINFYNPQILRISVFYLNIRNKMILLVRVNEKRSNCKPDENQSTNKCHHSDWDFFGDESSTNDCKASADKVAQHST